MEMEEKKCEPADLIGFDQHLKKNVEEKKP